MADHWYHSKEQLSVTVPYILGQGHGEHIMTNDLNQRGGTEKRVEECGLYSGFGVGEDVWTCVHVCVRESSERLCVCVVVGWIGLITFGDSNQLHSTRCFIVFDVRWASRRSNSTRIACKCTRRHAHTHTHTVERNLWRILSEFSCFLFVVSKLCMWR